MAEVPLAKDHLSRTEKKAMAKKKYCSPRRAFRPARRSCATRHHPHFVRAFASSYYFPQAIPPTHPQNRKRRTADLGGRARPRCSRDRLNIFFATGDHRGAKWKYCARGEKILPRRSCRLRRTLHLFSPKHLKVPTPKDRRRSWNYSLTRSILLCSRRRR